MLLLQLFLMAIFSVLIVMLTIIVIPEFIYRKVEGTKIEKFLDYYLVKAIWILVTVFGDTLLIVWFINIIC